MKDLWIPNSLWSVYFPKAEDEAGSKKHEFAFELEKKYNDPLTSWNETPEDFREYAEDRRNEYNDAIAEDGSEYPELLWEAEVLEKAAELLESVIEDLNAEARYRASVRYGLPLV